MKTIKEDIVTGSMHLVTPFTNDCPYGILVGKKIIAGQPIQKGQNYNGHVYTMYGYLPHRLLKNAGFRAGESIEIDKKNGWTVIYDPKCVPDPFAEVARMSAAVPNCWLPGKNDLGFKLTEEFVNLETPLPGQFMTVRYNENAYWLEFRDSLPEGHGGIEHIFNMQEIFKPENNGLTFKIKTKRFALPRSFVRKTKNPFGNDMLFPVLRKSGVTYVSGLRKACANCHNGFPTWIYHKDICTCEDCANLLGRRNIGWATIQFP